MDLNETLALNELTDTFYEMLPGSGNAHFSFPIAARTAGVGDFWIGGSKRPAIVHLLRASLDQRRNRFCPLVVSVVKLSIPWRSGRGDPLRRQEVDRVNAALLQLKFKIPELNSTTFLQGLERAGASGTANHKPEQRIPDSRIDHRALIDKLLGITNLEPRTRGIAFEGFLSDVFASFGLAPRGSIVIRGEQIDGSLDLDGDIYLLEAKWQGTKTGARELQAFAGSVRSKSTWTHGLFVSYSGFTDEGLEAFARGNATNVICMDGADLWAILDKRLQLGEALARKKRRAAETGRAFVPIRDLYHI